MPMGYITITETKRDERFFTVDGPAGFPSIDCEKLKDAYALAGQRSVEHFGPVEIFLLRAPKQTGDKT